MKTGMKNRFKDTTFIGNKPVRIEVNGVTIPARQHGYSTIWYTVSASSARRVIEAALGVGRRRPRPGYELLLPSSTHNGRRGKWAVKNMAGTYEMQFYYNATDL